MIIHHLLFVAGLLWACSPAQERGNYPYQNPELSIEKRVKDLLGRMSVEDKVNQFSAQGARIRIRSGSRRGVVIGMVNIPSGGEWTLCSASVVPVNGVHAVTMEFIGESSLDSFRFE